MTDKIEMSDIKDKRMQDERNNANKPLTIGDIKELGDSFNARLDKMNKDMKTEIGGMKTTMDTRFGEIKKWQENTDIRFDKIEKKQDEIDLELYRLDIQMANGNFKRIPARIRTVVGAGIDDIEISSNVLYEYY